LTSLVLTSIGFPVDVSIILPYSYHFGTTSETTASVGVSLRASGGTMSGFTSKGASRGVTGASGVTTGTGGVSFVTGTLLTGVISGSAGVSILPVIESIGFVEVQLEFKSACHFASATACDCSEVTTVHFLSLSLFCLFLYWSIVAIYYE